MNSVKPGPLPPRALLQRYVDSGDYTDCYCTEIQGTVKQAQFVAAFYTTAIFRLERFILRWLVNKPSTDADVDCLAQGSCDEFAAWTVEDRLADQLLLSDYRGRTRSWLMTATRETDSGPRTRLYFGSAVLRRSRSTGGKRRLDPGVRLLLGWHRLYSRVLLRAARARLGKSGN